MASSLFRQGDYYYLSVTSADSTNTNTGLTKNADFNNTFGLAGGIRFPESMDCALQSISLNCAGQAGVNAQSKVDVHVLASIIRPTVRVGGSQINSLRRIQCSQSNNRESFTFDTPLQFVPCSVSSFESITIQIVSDQFSSNGLPHQLKATHVPSNESPTTLTLVFRPSQAVVSG